MVCDNFVAYCAKGPSKNQIPSNDVDAEGFHNTQKGIASSSAHHEESSLQMDDSPNGSTVVAFNWRCGKKEVG